MPALAQSTTGPRAGGTEPRLGALAPDIRNRFDRSYMAPGFFGQSWGSWALFVLLVVSMFLFALSLNRKLRQVA